MSTPTLYLLTPPAMGDLPNVAQFLPPLLATGMVGAVQLRLKNAEDAAILRAAETLLPLCHAHEVSLIINDRPDLAAKAGADGVHLGRDDGSIAQARKLLGKEAVIGASCYDSMHRAMEAGEAGADYVAFGAFFPTQTKQAETRAEPMLLARWHVMAQIPVVAIGGITPENCAPLIAHGADMLAVCGGVWNHPQGPLAAVQAFQSVIDRTEQKPLSLALSDSV